MVEKTVRDQDVTLTLSCPAALWSGSENIVKVTIRNKNEKPVEYFPRNEIRCVTFDVVRQGQKVDKTAWGRAQMDIGEISRTAQKTSLAKGQEITVSLNLTRYFDLSVPGKYEIQAEWDGKLEGADKPLALTTPGLSCVVDVKPEQK